MNTDYKKLMEEAAAEGRYKDAARYEQLRNQKIEALNASGANKGGYTGSNDYYGWIDGNNYAADIQSLIANNGDKALVADLLDKRVDKSMNTIGMEGYAHDSVYDAAIQYLMSSPKQETFGGFSYNAAPTYTDKYQKQIDDLLNQILNREDFSYDVSKDPMYAQYAQQYQQQGQRSMKDTLGQLSARTGGLASSYAASAAQQANDYYMGQLANKVPELYQLAYGMYLDDKESQVQELGLLQNMSDSQYSRFRDTMSDWRNDRNFAYGAYRDDISDAQWADELAKSQAGILAQYGDFSGYKNLGFTDEQIGNMFNQYQKEDSKYYDETAYNQQLKQAETLAKYGDFSGYKALGYTDEQIAAMQKAYLEGQQEPEEDYKPTLTWAQVSAEIEKGNTSPEVMKAYKYYMGESYEDSVDYGNGYGEYGNFTSTGAYQPSEWAMVKNSLAATLREGNLDAAEAYMDKVASSMSEEQYQEAMKIFAQFGYTFG